MTEYEIIHETINPCGGEAHKAVEMEEKELASPKEYILALYGSSIAEISQSKINGSECWTVVYKGITHRYTFTEL